MTFEPDIGKLLSAAHHSGEAEVFYAVGPEACMADLSSMVQTNMVTGICQLIRPASKKSPILQFQWQLKPGVWVDCEADENERLVKARMAHRSVVKFSSHGNHYEINLETMEQTCTSVHAGAGTVRLRIAEKSTPGTRVVCGTQGVRRTPRSFRARAAPKTPSRPTRRTSSIQAGTRCFVGPPIPSGPLPHFSKPNCVDEFHHPAQLPHEPVQPSPPRVVLPDGLAWPTDPSAQRVSETLLSQLAPIAVDRRRRAFKGACLRWHPDKNLEDGNTATEVFQFLQRIKGWYLDELDEELLT